MKEKCIVWADADHLWCWNAFFELLEEEGSFKITKIPSIETEEILENCSGSEAVIIHCGTEHPTAKLVEIINSIKERFPSIKIGLQTEVTHPDVEKLVDFYIPLSEGLADSKSRLLKGLNQRGV